MLQGNIRELLKFFKLTEAIKYSFYYKPIFMLRKQAIIQLYDVEFYSLLREINLKVTTN